MPMLRLADIGIHYVLDGHPGQPVVVLLNGITMTTRCWRPTARSVLATA